MVTITGDGCFLMSAMEISTAAREGLPVKFFVLDDQAYHYMQELQRPAYLRTTATILARLDYRRWRRASASPTRKSPAPATWRRHPRRAAAQRPGADARGDRLPQAADPLDGGGRDRFTQELSTEQKVRFLPGSARGPSIFIPPAND